MIKGLLIDNNYSYVSIKLEEIAGFKNEVKEGLVYIGSAQAYVTGSIRRGRRVSDARTVLIVFSVTVTPFSTLVSI
jgi:hypothetical protein